ncbi:hypothetical protein M2440_002385 [Methylorubrum extorquens]|nr:hypothetical protein [Methylorubrum extorquens]
MPFSASIDREGLAAGGERVVDGGCEFAQLRHHLRAGRRIGDAQFDAAVDDADAAVRRDRGLAQDAAHVVAQAGDHRADEVGLVDL